MPKTIDRELMMIADDYEDVSKSKFGLYGYFTRAGECIYAGMDSNIDRQARHKHHLSPSKIKEQEINRYIQSKAKKGLTYSVIAICRDLIELENIETMYILFMKALGQCRFNKVVALTPDMSTKLLNGIADIGRN